MKKSFVVFGFFLIALVLITGCIDEESNEKKRLY